MGLPRRFLNLIVSETFRGMEHNDIRSLRCVDLTRHQLFHPDTSPPGSLALETIRLPSPTFRFKAWNSCEPLADRKVFCRQGHRHENSFLFDADTRQVMTMPTLRWFHYNAPVSLFVPRDGGGDPDPDAGLFFLQRWPEQERKRQLRPESNQFQALVYRRSSKTSPSKSWQHQLLPPPPYLRDTWYRRRCTKIMSYAVVGGGSHICISVNRAGTYCMDTVTHEWSKVGDWTMPFLGKVEYVPELKLWFGFSDDYNPDSETIHKDQRLVAADLSCMDSGPELVGTWKELDVTPIGCQQKQDSQLVYLGSGRFCIVKILRDSNFTRAWYGGNENFAVLTGLEVQRVHDDGGCSGGGKVELRVIRGQSRRTPNGIYIEKAF